MRNQAGFEHTTLRSWATSSAIWATMNLLRVIDRYEVYFVSKFANSFKIWCWKSAYLAIPGMFDIIFMYFPSKSGFFILRWSFFNFIGPKGPLEMIDICCTQEIEVPKNYNQELLSFNGYSLYVLHKCNTLIILLIAIS